VSEEWRGKCGLCVCVCVCVWSLVHRLALSTSRGEYSCQAAVFHINYQTTMASNPQRGLRSALLTNDNVGIFNRTGTKQTDFDTKAAQSMRQCSMPDMKQNFQRSTNTYTRTRVIKVRYFLCCLQHYPPIGIYQTPIKMSVDIRREIIVLTFTFHTDIKKLYIYIYC